MAKGQKKEQLSGTQETFLRKSARPAGLYALFNATTLALKNKGFVQEVGASSVGATYHATDAGRQWLGLEVLGERSP